MHDLYWTFLRFTSRIPYRYPVGAAPVPRAPQSNSTKHCVLTLSSRWRRIERGASTLESHKHSKLLIDVKQGRD
jgi:hypothetical protein